MEGWLERELAEARRQLVAWLDAEEFMRRMVRNARQRVMIAESAEHSEWESFRQWAVSEGPAARRELSRAQRALQAVQYREEQAVLDLQDAEAALARRRKIDKR